ncbi:MAG: DDE-type integrase/transposase/recombinase, partial [Gammaproteobacteria bacterium]
ASFEAWSRGLSLTFVSRVHLFARKYEMGTISVEAWIKELIPSFSTRSLIRWYSAKRGGKISTLAVDRALSRKGTGVLDSANDGAVRTFVLALIAHQPHLAAHDVRDQVEDRFGRQLQVKGKAVPLPPVRAFQRMIAVLKQSHEVALTKITNPDKYRSTMAPAGTGTLRHVTVPNTLWQIDASPVDVLCTDGRHSMYGCIDIATRRFVITVSKTPRSSAVALMLRKAMLEWGVPQTIKTDNGSDFTAHDTKRLFVALGIEMDVSDAYSPQQKGHIERAIRTFQHNVAPLLPGFVGHSVEDRKAIESRLSFAKRLGATEDETFGVQLTAVQLQGYIDQWLDQVYQHREHGGLKGKTPFQVAAESSAPKRMVDERALDLLLMPVAGKDGRRVTTKFGVRIDGYHYQTPAILPGVPVFVRMDPLDAGRAYAFAADGAEFLGEALCAELRGLNPAELQKVTREAHDAIIAGKMAEAKKHIRDLGKRPLIEAALRVAAAKAPNVIALPKRHEEHSTPHIEAAIAAMAKAPAAPQFSEAGAAAHASLLAEGAEPVDPKVRKLRTEETMHQRFRRALDVELRLESSEPVSDQERGWLEGYRTSPEYRSMRDMWDESEGQMSL